MAIRSQPPSIHLRRCPAGELTALLFLYAQRTRIAALRDMLMDPTVPITALPGTVTELQGILAALAALIFPVHPPTRRAGNQNATLPGAAAGQGNFPAAPQYLAPPMPWPSWRHKTDGDLCAIVAYLKHGIKPVNNQVPDSQGPPDHWASGYTPDKIGPYPLTPYPTGNETFQP
jgi:hypothetical protein